MVVSCQEVAGVHPILVEVVDEYPVGVAYLYMTHNAVKLHHKLFGKRLHLLGGGPGGGRKPGGGGPPGGGGAPGGGGLI